MEYTMKYVRFLNLDGEDSIIVFSNHLNHKETVSKCYPSKVLGAGFVRISIKSSDLSLSCYGRSESLNIDSQPEDTEFLIASLYS